MPDRHFTALTGDRVVLRRFAMADVATFVAYRSDPDVARYQSWEAPYPRAAGERMIRELLREYPDTPGQWFQFAMELRATGELIGDCASGTDLEDARQAEIGFTLRPEFQGHGYATEGARTLLGYLFGARDKHRVTARCDPRNPASVGGARTARHAPRGPPGGEHLGEGRMDRRPALRHPRARVDARRS